MPVTRPALAAFLAAVFAGILAASAPAAACPDGQVLGPGESCVVTVKWGHDHWVKGDFPENGGNTIEFRHVQGKCSVALFGPAEGLLSPDQPPVRSTLPGEYHLFTRAITVAQETCQYRIAVE